VIFVNPSTPDGRFYKLDTLIKEWIKKNATIIIDESFLDFTDFTSAIKYLKKYKKLYIIKSMTKLVKAHAAAIVVGARVPAILPSRGDSDKSKLYSIALAALNA
jgi:threonine-phosphate decarboxylase